MVKYEYKVVTSDPLSIEDKEHIIATKLVGEKGVKSLDNFHELEEHLIASGKLVKMEKLLRVSKVAKLLDVSRQMVYRYISQKHIEALQLPSGGTRIKASEVQRFIFVLAIQCKVSSKSGLQ